MHTPARARATALMLLIALLVAASPAHALVPLAPPAVHQRIGELLPAFEARYPVPGEIDATCGRDVTAELLAWIAGVPDGSTLVFESGACHRIDGELRIEDRHDLTFEGNGAELRAVAEGDRDRRHLYLFGGSNLVLRDLVIRGANPRAGTATEAYRPDRAFQHGVALHGVQGALLERMTITDVFGDFVYLGLSGTNGHAGDRAWCRDIEIRDSRFERNGRQGIGIVAAERVAIRDSYLGDVRRSIFDLEPNSNEGGARDILIEGNRTGRSRLLWLASKGHGSNVSNLSILDNVMEAPSGVPIILIEAPRSGRRSGVVIEGNEFVVAGSPQPAFRFTRVDDVVLRDNTASFPPNRRMTAVRLESVTGFRSEGNAFSGCAVC